MLDTLIHVSAYFPAKLDTIIYGYNYLNQRVWKLTRYWYLGSCSEPGGGGEDSFDPGGGEEMDDGGGGGGDPMNCPHEGADLTFYVWSGDEVIAEYDIVDSLKNQYVFANGRVAVQLTRSGGGTRDTNYVHHDYLGNARLSTSREGATNSLEYFDIWGESRQLSGAAIHNYRFIGRERDALAWEDHHYLRNRFYNPSIGRFLTPDPLISGINTYAYCNQNPVMYNDRSGLMPGNTGAARYWSKVKSITLYYFYVLVEAERDKRKKFKSWDSTPTGQDAIGNDHTSNVHEGEGTAAGATGSGGGGGEQPKKPLNIGLVEDDAPDDFGDPGAELYTPPEVALTREEIAGEGGIESSDMDILNGLSDADFEARMNRLAEAIGEAHMQAKILAGESIVYALVGMSARASIRGFGGGTDLFNAGAYTGSAMNATAAALNSARRNDLSRAMSEVGRVRDSVKGTPNGHRH